MKTFRILYMTLEDDTREVLREAETLQAAIDAYARELGYDWRQQTLRIGGGPMWMSGSFTAKGSHDEVAVFQISEVTPGH